MRPYIEIKKEKFIAAVGIILLTIVLLLKLEMPLALLIIVTIGFLLSLKFKLPGSIFLFFGGLALAIYPLLFSSTFWLMPGAIVTSFAGFLMLISWWKQN